MKTIIALSFLVILITGCGVSNLVSLEEEGLLTKHPIRITDSTNVNGLTVRANISRSDRESLSFSNEIPEGDSTSFSHFAFDVPRFQFNGEVEFSFGDHVAFLSGLSFAKINGKEFLGTHLGISFFRIGKINTIRFDIGAKFQKLNYRLIYAKTYENIFSEDRVRVYNVNSSGNYRNLFLGFTINGNNKEAFLNYFLSYMLAYQTFFDFPSNSLNPGYDLNSAFHSLSFGVFKNIDHLGKLIFGARITNYQFDFGEVSPFDLFLQYDFSLF